MPIQTKEAINWALQQMFKDNWGNSYPVTLETIQPLTDNVRLYFNNNSIAYSTFSYDDLKQFI